MSKFTVHGLPGVYNASPITLSDGQGSALAVDVNGQMIVSATDLDVRDITSTSDSILIYGSDDGGTTKRVIKTDSGGAIQVDIESIAVTIDSEFPNAAAITDDFANPTTTNVMAMGMLWDGATWDRMLGDSTDGVLVNLGGNNDVGLNAGTNTIGKLAANSGVDIGDVDILSVIPGTGATNLGKAEDAAHSSGDTGVMIFAVRNDNLVAPVGTDGDYSALQTNSVGRLYVTGQNEGTTAHDFVDSGNPLKIGGRAQEPTAQPDEVSNDDRVDGLFDRAGRMAIYQGYPRWYAAINTATSGNNTIKAAAGAGKKIVVTSLAIVSDGTVDIRWESGADGTALSGQIPLQAREGYAASDSYGLFETAANTLLNLELSAAINVHGHIAGIIIDD